MDSSEISFINKVPPFSSLIKLLSLFESAIHILSLNSAALIFLAFRRVNKYFDLLDLLCISRATSSLPTPLPPVMSIRLLTSDSLSIA